MQSIEAAFEHMGWQCETMPERHAVRSVFTGRETSYQTFVMRLPDEGLYRFVIVCALQASEAHMVALGEFLHRINGTLPLGAFELDFERLTVRWVGSVETMGEPIPPPWIGASVQRGLTSFETVWPELLAVCEGRLTAQPAELRCQLAMELPGLNEALAGHNIALSLSAIDDGDVHLLVQGGDAEVARPPLEALFGAPLPFSLRSA